MHFIAYINSGHSPPPTPQIVGFRHPPYLLQIQWAAGWLKGLGAGHKVVRILLLFFSQFTVNV